MHDLELEREGCPENYREQEVKEHVEVGRIQSALAVSQPQQRKAPIQSLEKMA